MNFQSLKSVTLHPDIIDELHSECAKGHLAGTYNSPPSQPPVFGSGSHAQEGWLLAHDNAPVGSTPEHH